MHSVIANHPALKSIAARREELAEARNANGALVRDAQVNYDAARVEWKEAAARGEDPGPEPEVPAVLNPEVRRTFADRMRDELAALRAEERETLEANAGEFAADLAALEAQGLTRAAKHVEALDAIAADLAPVVEAIQHLRAIVGDSANAVDGPIDAVALVAATHSGRLLTEPSVRVETKSAGNVVLTTRPSQVAPEDERYEVKHRGKVYRTAQRAARSHERA